MHQNAAQGIERLRPKEGVGSSNLSGGDPKNEGRRKSRRRRVVTLTIDLPAQTEHRLSELAQQSGQDLAGYALTVITSHVNALEEAAAADRGGDLLAEAVARMAGRTPEQIAEARERALGFIRPGKPLAAGQTIFDAVVGKWPGDETDEEVAEALRKLS